MNCVQVIAGKMPLLCPVISFLVSVCILQANGDFILGSVNSTPFTEVYSSTSFTANSSPLFSSPNFSINQGSVSPSSSMNAAPSSVLQTQTPASEVLTSPHVKVPDVVRTFALDFIQRIEQDQTVKNAFSYQRLTADEARNLTFDIVSHDHSAVNGDDPARHAAMVADAMKANFEYAKTDNIVRLFAYGVGQNLLDKGILTPDNVLEFSQKFSDAVRDNVNSAFEHTPEADIRAVTKGFMDFLTSVKLYEEHSAPDIAVYYAKELNELKKYSTYN